MALGRSLYSAQYGSAYVGDSLDLLDQLEADSIDLVITSPPFALQREKSYGNVTQETYVDWLFEFCKKVYRVLAPLGSFVIDLGGAYQSKRPIRSLHNYDILIRLCEELDFRLAEEFFWFNPARLPSPNLRLCSALEIEAHPARFPVKLPTFFIKFLTEPGDLALDIFAGSNTTGLAAEATQRRWLAFEKQQQYLAASIFRFLDKDISEKQARVLYMSLLDFHESIHIKRTIIAAEELSEEILDTQLSLFEL